MTNRRQTEWIMVRLRRTTHAALRALVATWKRAHDHGYSVPPPDERDKISIDRAVSELLKRDMAHRARGRTHSRAKSRAKRPETEGGPGAYEPDQKGQ